MRRWVGQRGRAAARAAIAFAGVALITVIAASSALADCGNTVAAVLQGQWQYMPTITYTPSVPANHFGLAPGAHPIATFAFTSTCGGPSTCNLAIGSATNPSGPVEGVGVTLYTDGSNTTLPQQASDYTAVYPSGGFGGPNLPPCRPPSLASTMHIHVAAAAQVGGVWQATYVTGEETSVAWWTCNGSVGVASSVEHVSFVAVPAGHAFPASLAALCAPPTQPAVVATTTTPAATNPQQSTISTALATPAGSFGSLGHAVQNALITLGIVLFITFPATLFNKTFEENYDDIRDIMQRRFGWLARLSKRLAAGESRGREVGVFALVVLVGAAVGGLNDPNFGFNGASLKTYIAVILAVLFGVGVSSLVGYAYRRIRHLGVSAKLTALPAGLVVAGACVLVSRLTQFQPGYLYGVICGVAFAATLQRNESGHLVAIASVATLALGVLAWLVWVPVKQAAGMPDASPLTLVAGDFLAAVFVGGLVGSVIGLVPLRFLPGGALAQWNRAVWGGLFGLAVFGLLQVMLRPESSSVHTGTKAVVTAAVLFIVFGGLSVAFRMYFTRRARRRSQAAVPA